mgnify:CR=1 FL=1
MLNNTIQLGDIIVNSSSNTKSEVFELDDHYVTLKEPFLGDVKQIPRKRVEDMLATGQLTLARKSERDKSFKTLTSKDFSSYTLSERKLAIKRESYLNALTRRGITTYTKKTMQGVLNEHAKDIGDDSPHDLVKQTLVIITKFFIG